MPPIRLLDQNTINQIAAGEVVERPSSVVKELVENAMDAGATAITIEIREGGISFLRVTDNGCGIPADEVALAFRRHSTSKIRGAEDLLSISSLGFRGEALSSIAAVAQVEVITRTPESLTGLRYRIEGSEEKGAEEIGAPGGTTFIVRNLFFNTPARKKFLKTAVTEASYISALMERLALSRPDISFRLIAGGQTKLHTAGNHKLKDIIYTVYGREITAGLLPFSYTSERMRLEGYVGKPEISRGNRSFENYFINGRYVKCAIVTRAIENAYHGFMMQHKYPFVVFHFEMDSSLLDVNVHPTKMELRFGNEEEVYTTVYEGIRAALSGREFIPANTFGTEKKTEKEPKETEKPERGSVLRGPEPFEERRRQADTLKENEVPYEPSTVERIRRNRKNSLIANQSFQAKSKSPAGGEPAEAVPAEEKEVPETKEVKEAASPAAAPDTEKTYHQAELWEDPLFSRKARGEYRVIGQLFETYWLIQYRDQLFIMDQHAAHEKVLYEKTMRQMKNREYTSQQVQPPLILTLNAREEEILHQYHEQFTAVGFVIEPFGGKEYAVYAVPANLFGLARSDLFIEMMDSLTEESGHSRMTMIEEKIALMSCKAAVKGNHHLSFAEAEALIDELMELENPYMCPHGRPTMITMSRYELEKKFKRVVS